MKEKIIDALAYIGTIILILVFVTIVFALVVISFELIKTNVQLFVILLAGVGLVFFGIWGFVYLSEKGKL